MVSNPHAEFLDVTEIEGQKMSADQFHRLHDRYYWAGQYCEGKRVLEVACGSAAGLGYLQSMGAKVVGTDISAAVIAGPLSYYGDRVDLRLMDAENLDFEDSSFDVVMIFEALYYLNDADRFVSECRRLLRPGGKVLVVNVNKDIADFNPSPFSTTYHGVPGLAALFGRHGFSTRCWGVFPVATASLRQQIFRPLKKMAVSFGLVPKTMNGKRFLKRLVFGRLETMPAEVEAGKFPPAAQTELSPGEPSREHLVLYCVAELNPK